eukprot:jgi/Mesen1/6329/ME000328S05613
MASTGTLHQYSTLKVPWVCAGSCRLSKVELAATLQTSQLVSQKVNLRSGTDASSSFLTLKGEGSRAQGSALINAVRCAHVPSREDVKSTNPRERGDGVPASSTNDCVPLSPGRKSSQRMAGFQRKSYSSYSSEAYHTAVDYPEYAGGSKEYDSNLYDRKQPVLFGRRTKGGKPVDHRKGKGRPQARAAASKDESEKAQGGPLSKGSVEMPGGEVSGTDSDSNLAGDVSRGALVGGLLCLALLRFRVSYFPQVLAATGRNVVRSTVGLLSQPGVRVSLLRSPAGWGVAAAVAVAGLVTAVRAQLATECEETCHMCNGHGEHVCDLCEGRGEIAWEGKLHHRDPCPACFGKRNKKCKACGGNVKRSDAPPF